MEAPSQVRRLIPFLLAIVLLLPAAASPIGASALAITCQTPNGAKTMDDITHELSAAGYSGPWQVDQMISAYGRASGGGVTCDNGSRTTPSAGRQAVLFIGGLGSTVESNQETVSMLDDELVANWGYRRSDVQVFEYGLFDGEDPSLSCGGSAIPDLLTVIRSLKNQGFSGVVLVGHSNGGAIAIQTADQHEVPMATDGQPFVRRVLAVDSPLEGISGFRAAVRDLVEGPCPALETLVARFANPQIIQPWMAQMANDEMQRGIQVFAVANPEDFYVHREEQEIFGAPVNFTIDVTDGSFSDHWAIFKTAAGVRQLAAYVGSQL